MGIERHGWGQYQLICDNCETVADPGFSSFREASSWARVNDWQLRKEHGEWVNYCPDCAITEGLVPPPRGELVYTQQSEAQNRSSVLRDSPYTEKYFQHMGKAFEEVKSGKLGLRQASMPSPVEPDDAECLEAALARIRAAAR